MPGFPGLPSLPSLPSLPTLPTRETRPTLDRDRSRYPKKETDSLASCNSRLNLGLRFVLEAANHGGQPYPISS